VLLLCFVFYMVAFLFYALGEALMAYLAAASALYGLGEAFRSGTHKAMIMVWLDRHKLSKFKTFVYSRTRSFSNLGSALNAVLSLLIILAMESYALVFLVSVLPFVADFLMVATYPAYMNDTPDTKPTCGAIVGGTLGALRAVM